MLIALEHEAEPFPLDVFPSLDERYAEAGPTMYPRVARLRALLRGAR
ncbi:MAG: hypothetical protein R3A49_11825 [Acidimicrobiia bacterium]